MLIVYTLRIFHVNVNQIMNIPEHIFRAYDIRGLMHEITPEIAEKVGAALVKKSGAQTVIVGRDMRKTSPELMKAAIQGITSQGANVLEIGMCTTSMFNFAVSHYEDVDAGLMVTASHNPAEYNGIKMGLSNGLPISGSVMLSLIQEDMSPAEAAGWVEKRDILNDYLDIVIERADAPDLTGTKLVVDYGNGMGSVSVQPLLERLGVEVVELYAEPDASFPNHEANPAKEETLTELKRLVVAEKADFGVALDGDADRIGFVDNEGNSLRGDLMLAVLAKEILKKRPGGKVITAPNHGWAAKKAITEAGGEAIDVRIGRTFVIEQMHENGAILGGEISSHFFFEEFNGLEAVDYALVLALSIWKRSGMTFADMTRDLRSYVNSGEVNVEVEDKDVVISRIKETYVSQATLVNEMDGIRCEFNEDWWFILRASNTEPLLRLTVEAKTEELMQEKVEEIRGMME